MYPFLRLFELITIPAVTVANTAVQCGVLLTLILAGTARGHASQTEQVIAGQ